MDTLSKAQKKQAQAARRAADLAEREAALNSAPAALPRGVRFYYSPREWRLLAGLEVGQPQAALRFDLYLGIGPAMVRVSL